MALESMLQHCAALRAPAAVMRRRWMLPFDGAIVDVHIDYGTLQGWGFKANKRICGAWSAAEIAQLVGYCVQANTEGLHINIKNFPYYIAHYYFSDTKSEHEVRHQLAVMSARHHLQ